MARKTKKEALETRAHILATAEQIFSEKGVAHTTLQDIAVAANVTRGAIYWHFKNRIDLLDALLQRVKTPMEEGLRRSSDGSMSDPLGQLRLSAIETLNLVRDDPSARRVCEILIFKCEYVAETIDLQRRYHEDRNSSLGHYEAAFRNAMARDQLTGAVDPRYAAIGFHAMLHGILKDWLLAPEEFDLTVVGTNMADTFIAGLKITRHD
ncbi:TetR family transcriptional regulator [Pigmentiphaga kullae]|uniref:TetR family transcriptional regulator n=1 Tax=Pigmentiphaga kullae TaxID=151784 RepID=A0A4Q7NH16_9BURK|nr:TetR family transcriptional regulator [Pigmentiphaga kullae]RZS84254.1 TetR family transcriptional regulator [Pigmentiphaga kullae]